jgi:hypothetical protein
MAKFCHEMHHVLPTSLIYVVFSPLALSLRNRKYDGFHAFYFETDDVIIIIKMLEIILISTRRGCSIAVGS